MAEEPAGISVIALHIHGWTSYIAEARGQGPVCFDIALRPWEKRLCPRLVRPEKNSENLPGSGLIWE